MGKIIDFPQTVEEDPNADYEFEIEAATDKQAIATAVRLLSTLYGSKVVVEK